MVKGLYRFFTSWSRQDMEKHLELTERFLTALRTKAAGLPFPAKENAETEPK